MALGRSIAARLLRVVRGGGRLHERKPRFLGWICRWRLRWAEGPLAVACPQPRRTRLLHEDPAHVLGTSSGFRVHGPQIRRIKGLVVVVVVVAAHRRGRVASRVGCHAPVGFTGLRFSGDASRRPCACGGGVCSDWVWACAGRVLVVGLAEGCMWWWRLGAVCRSGPWRGAAGGYTYLTSKSSRLCVSSGPGNTHFPLTIL